MSQIAFIQSGSACFQIELPAEYEEALPGVKWGDVTGFPTLAYWAYRIYERRLVRRTLQYRLGTTLLEEVAACLLGGHGIPASMGLAAFKHLKKKGVFTGEQHPTGQIFEWLSEPIKHNSRFSKYRFARQKANYLADAITYLSTTEAPEEGGKSLRNWLLPIRGIGPKTASWIARNWLDADDVAILDIHIFRAGLLAGFFNPDMTVEKNYFELEDQFLKVATALNVGAAELDAVIWYEMQQSSSVQALLKNRFRSSITGKTSGGTTSYQSDTHPHQIALV